MREGEGGRKCRAAGKGMEDTVWWKGLYDGEGDVDGGALA